MAETDRPPLTFFIDGRAARALEGDTLLVAMLCNDDAVRRSEFGPERRAGFCLMGSCQDCGVWLADGTRLRACGTAVTEGLAVLTAMPALL
nr:(2Fe-2S)-binding protein [Achromobacter aloeverae]